jgi:hypothetical protein
MSNGMTRDFMPVSAEGSRRVELKEDVVNGSDPAQAAHSGESAMSSGRERRATVLSIRSLGAHA